MTVLGKLIIVLTCTASAISVFSYVRAVGAASFLQGARRWVYISAFGVLLSSCILLTQIITHDFTNGYVFSYSSRDLPSHFLISSFYAGQEGSFLFWALCNSVISIFLLRSTRKGNTEGWVMTVFMAVNTVLLLLLIVKSPFQHVWDMFPHMRVNQIPPDGRGLNQLLQNFWMVVHPPVLFIGFAALAVPFAYALGGLWKKQYTILAEQSLPWVLFATLVLGLGIMLGAYWAYGVLGWGGYWGWDPVENSSLVPWLTAVALLHTLLAQRRVQKYVRTNFILAIVSFFLVVYSTFLTRSGILGDASVHSFTDPGATVYWVLVVFLAAIAVGGVGLLLVRRRDLRPEVSPVQFLSRESILGWGSLALVLCAGVVLFGTSFPLFSTGSVEPSFYDTTTLPVAIVIMVLLGFSLFMQWRTQDGIRTLTRSLRSLGGAVVVTGVLYAAGVRDAVALGFIGTSFFALLSNLEFAVRLLRVDAGQLGGKLAHIGLALFFVGVIATGRFSTTAHVSLPLGLPQKALGHTLTYTGYEPTPDGKFAFHVTVADGGQSFLLSPVMFEAGQQGIMRNPDIASFVTSDFYVSPVSLEQPDHAANRETYTIPKGGSVAIGDVTATFVKFDMDAGSTGAMMGNQGGMAIGSVLELSRGTKNETVVPVAVYNGGGEPSYRPSSSALINGHIQLVSMNVGSGPSRSTVTVEVQRNGAGSTAPQETLVVEASIKPFISVLWGGTAVMFVGFIVAMVKRSKE